MTAVLPRVLTGLFCALGVCIGACSSDGDSPVPAGDAAQGDAAAGDAATACVPDEGKLAEDDSESCCPGLFKSCPSVKMANDAKPRVCSTVECGTAEKQPPPNVQCCPGVQSECSMVLGSGQVKCVCGGATDN